MLISFTAIYLLGIIQAIIEIDIKRQSILKENESRDIVKNQIYFANTLPMISISLGNPKQNLQMIIDTFAYYSWVLNTNDDSYSYDNYNSSISTTYYNSSITLKTTFEYNLFKINGNEGRDVIWLKDIQISHKEHYPFINCLNCNTDNDPLNFNGYIALTKPFNDTGITETIGGQPVSKPLGLIQHLFNEGIINNTVFSIYYTSDYRGVLKIGTIDTKIPEDQISYCPLRENNKTKPQFTNVNTWECRLYLISFGSYIQSNNSTVLFGSGQEHIFAPIEHYKLLEEIKNYAEKYSANCFIREKDKVITLRCEEFDLSKEHFPSLELQLKTYRVFVKATDLFVWSDEEDDLLECVLHINKHFNNWLLGDPGLKREYVIYDAANERIGFVDRDFIVEYLTPSVMNSIWLYFLLWVIICIFGYYFFIKQRKTKRNNNKQTEMTTKFVNK